MPLHGASAKDGGLGHANEALAKHQAAVLRAMGSRMASVASATLSWISSSSRGEGTTRKILTTDDAASQFMIHVCEMKPPNLASAMHPRRSAFKWLC